MPKMNDNEIRKYLPAFADGELDVEQNLLVLEHMAMDPTATRRVMHQQQLKQAVARHINDQTPLCPDALRQRVMALTADKVAAPDTDATLIAEPPAMQRQRSVIATIRRWTPAAVAAVLFVAAMVAVMSGAPSTNAPKQTIFEARTISTFASRHAKCSSDIKAMHPLAGSNDKVQLDVTAVPAAVAAHLNQGDAAVPSLDLSGIGYEFSGAGACVIPGTPSAHLVYKPVDGSDHDAVSLWIKAYNPASDPMMETGHVYRASSLDDQRPLLIWQKAGMIYYLIGNSPDQLEAVARLVRGDV